MEICRNLMYEMIRSDMTVGRISIGESFYTEQQIDDFISANRLIIDMACMNALNTFTESPDSWEMLWLKECLDIDPATLNYSTDGNFTIAGTMVPPLITTIQQVKSINSKHVRFQDKVQFIPYPNEEEWFSDYYNARVNRPP